MIQNHRRCKLIKTSKVLKIIKSLPLFGTLTDAELAALIEKSTQAEYKAGNELDSSGAITVILSGCVAVTKRTGEKKLLMRMLTEGSVTGVASLYSDGCEAVSSLSATKNASALHIPQKVISSLIHGNGDFAERYIVFLTSRIRFLNRRIKAYTTGSAEARVALHILMSDETHKGEIDLGVSYTDLADMLDIGRASLYRALDDLTARGIISRQGRKIVISDACALSSITEGSQNQ